MSSFKKNFIFQDINTLKGIGPVLSKYLKKKKIDKIKDVVLEIPYSQTDRSKISKVKELEIGKGNFYLPTIFDNVDKESTIAQDEIFGPVTSIFDFEDNEQAIEIANSTNYGLASGVFTSDDQKAKWTAERINAGIIWQNDWFVDGVNLPGGGYKRSGYGRDGGIDGIYSHGQTKRISKRLK